MRAAADRWRWVANLNFNSDIHPGDGNEISAVKRRIYNLKGVKNLIAKAKVAFAEAPAGKSF